MARKFFIQDWENFSDIDKKHIKELISISLQARELRLKLLGIKNVNNIKIEIKEHRQEKSFQSSVNIFNEDIEVTGDKNESGAEPIDQAIPRVAAFLLTRPQTIAVLEQSLTDCEKSCKDQILSEIDREKCKDKCKEKQQKEFGEILRLIL
jgi:hypothetical protein